MRQITSLLVALCAIFSMSCDALNTASSTKVSSQGAPYELIVVCNQPEWEGEIGELIREALEAEIPYLTQPEPLFNIYRVTHQGYDNLIPKHRNILTINVNKHLYEPAIYIQYDVNAAPQIIISVQGPTVQSVCDYFREQRGKIRLLLEMAERERDVNYGKKFNVESLDKLIKEKFDVSMHIPQGYTLRNEGEDFVWMSYEYPTASQGILLYSYPVEEAEPLKLKALLEARNKYAALIPGPSEGSYMSTFMDVDPDYRFVHINGRRWAEMRGLWDVTGDFMGGPFVSYSIVDERTNRVFTVDLYVYSPKLGKRNFLRGLEHIIYNVDFPETASE